MNEKIKLLVYFLQKGDIDYSYSNPYLQDLSYEVEDEIIDYMDYWNIFVEYYEKIQDLQIEKLVEAWILDFYDGEDENGEGENFSMCVFELIGSNNKNKEYNFSDKIREAAIRDIIIKKIETVLNIKII